MTCNRGLCLGLAALMAALAVQGATDCSSFLCSTCNEPTGRCTLCIGGYFLDRDGFCTKCADPLCDKCEANGTCTQCVEFNYDSAGDTQLVYQDDGGTCRTCAATSNDGCAACDSTGTCAQCKLGFFLNSTAGCTPCADPLCERCVGARGKRCLSCKKVWFGPDDYEEPSRPVYVNASGKCAICTDHSYKNGCQACTVDGKRCSLCAEGYRLDELTGKCNACKDLLCAQCSADLSTCLTCMTAPPWAESDWDYGPIYRSEQGRCTECVDHNRGQGCTECNQQGQCTKCVGPEAFLRNGACAPCNALTDRCTRCTKTGVCKACEDGWALQAGKCVPCSDPLCNACSSPNRCTLCKTVVDESVRNSPTLYLDNTGRCRQNAKECMETLASGLCRTCQNGYRKIGGRCVKCPKYDECVRCTDPVMGCQQCSSDGSRCIRCLGMPGHDKKCRRCADQNCYCDADYRKCEGCRYGAIGTSLQFDAATKTCKECPEGCGACNRNGCSYCNDGYVRVGKICKRCVDPLCGSCDAATQKKCTQCRYTGDDDVTVYQDRAGQCRLCSMKGCMECRRDGLCKSCQYGYTLTAGRCSI